jgi:hypothetical protein
MKDLRRVLPFDLAIGFDSIWDRQQQAESGHEPTLSPAAQIAVKRTFSELRLFPDNASSKFGTWAGRLRLPK